MGRRRTEEPDAGEFDQAEIWYITFERLERIKEHLPHLYAAVLKAKDVRFEGWAQLSNSYSNEPQVISYDVACELADLYSDDGEAVLDECHQDMVETNRTTETLDLLDLDFEFPEDFPTFQTSPNF